MVTINPPGAGTPTGTVIVRAGAESCSAPAGAGMCSLTFTTSGTRTLTATYIGDGNFNGAASTPQLQRVGTYVYLPLVTR
jgi:hypothetical protein